VRDIPITQLKDVRNSDRRPGALYLTKGLRMFAYGLAIVALPLHLVGAGLSPLWLGLLPGTVIAGAAG